MEKINKEHDTEYKYCPDRHAYCSYNSKGNLVGVFPEEYVQDPLELWRQKSIQAGYTQEDGTINFEDDRVKTLKPTETVWKIWEHHNANSND